MRVRTLERIPRWIFCLFFRKFKIAASLAPLAKLARDVLKFAAYGNTLFDGIVSGCGEANGCDRVYHVKLNLAGQLA